MKLRQILIIFILVFEIQHCKGQENYDITYEDASLKFGLHLSPNGYGLAFRNAFPYKEGTSKLLDISLTSVKSFKEKQILNQRMVNTSPYIYGKVNRLYAFRPLVGVQKVLAEKHNRNSVGVNFFALTGPILGLLKPVYIDIESFDPNAPGVVISSSVQYNPELQNQDRITGYSSFLKGSSQTKLLGAWSFKSGVEFNWGYYSSEYKSIEIGILVDYFPSRPQVMHFIKNKVIYSSFYISFAFGKNY